MAASVPPEIYRKLSRLQPLSEEEERQYGEGIDWQLVWEYTRSKVYEVFWRSRVDFSRDEGWLGSAEGIPSRPDQPRPTSVAEGRQALWDWFGGPASGSGRRPELPDFVESEYKTALAIEIAKDSERALGTKAVKDSEAAKGVDDRDPRIRALEVCAGLRGKSREAMKQQLAVLGVKNLPILDEDLLSSSES